MPLSLFGSRQTLTTRLRRGISLSVGLAMGLAGGAIAQTTPQPDITSSTRFACQSINGQYTVMYYPQSQPGQAYAWATPTELGGGWTEERRCSEISRRLESYRPDGLLEMQTGVENGYNTICVTTQQDASCRIVLTVPPGQDPLVMRNRVFENLAVADRGQQTDSVTTFTGGDDGILNRIGEALDIDLPGSRRSNSSTDSINLRPFLDQADGGTGTRLQGGTPAQSSPQLNPDSFR
ncbi:hypothetical protein H6G00_27555 [Leptolyngbya sp. FACHB-541]|uniref:COP23 domain-containing protein n=1 Tax=Leptolyngbya sp. FACHB-541 TaxID=2692810 RepID=UPI00168727DF|nr:COP23 domain-containing protein [Leptolyngbya sp. FACHB-541]MBD2000314.1 hypothetical protein [Leptolyngbya sp. FACHB-541]